MMCQRQFYSLLGVVVLLDLVSGLSLVTSSSQNPERKANYSCYSCPLSEAQSIQTVYDKHNGEGDFWYRNGSALASCNFSSIYASKRKCSVCVKRPETVVVVLCNLTSGEEPLFEGKHGPISFNKTSCPQPEPINLFESSLSERDATQANESEGPRILTGCLLAVIFSGLMIMIIIIKSLTTPVDGSSTTSSGPEGGSELINTHRNGSIV